MTASSGHSLLRLYEQLNRPMLFSRMFLGSSVWHSRLLHLIWRQKDTRSNRLLFQLAPLVHGTDETGCGLLPINEDLKKTTLFPTPKATEIDEIPEQWRERRKNPKNKQMGASLTVVAKMFPTPAARDYKGARKPETMKKTGRNPETNSLPDATEGHHMGQLNPDWVEWLMAYPPGWTTLEKNPTSRESQKEKKDRVNRLKALGNAIYPPVAFLIFEAIKEIHENN